ncbi:MAG TPA: hypothetical protein VFZ48_03700 [Candidatus Saccharimonadales bacterium]
MNTDSYPIFLSGPRTATGAALVLGARQIPMSGAMLDLRRHLVDVVFAPAPCWRSEQDSGVFAIAGPADLDVTPYLQKLATWIARQDFKVEVYVTDSGGERFAQIRSVFPDAQFTSEG